MKIFVRSFFKKLFKKLFKKSFSRLWILSLMSLSLLALVSSAQAARKKNTARRTVIVPGLSDQGLSKSELAGRVRDRLDKLVTHAGLSSASFGLWVGRSTELGIETYYKHNADQQFIPASLSKLVTLATVLHDLSPGFKFKTQLLSSADLKDGKLMGSIYLKGGGDPSFVSENMWVLVNDLTHAGVKEVMGDVIVDDTRFDSIRFGADRQKERVDRAYDAPVGAMSMNWNAVNVYVRPGNAPGEKCHVSVDLTTPYIIVRNETKTAGAGRGQTISVERETDSKSHAEVITVRGAMGVGVPETVVYKSITSPDLFAGNNLVDFLQQRGIKVTGQVKTGVAPVDTKVIASVDGKPLAQVVADMAKFSNNFVAEMLTKNMASESGEHPATMASGLEHDHRYLESIGIPKGSYEFVNAAGFTRDNLLTPAQLGRLLETVHRDFTIYPEFLVALPIAGVDGTLHKRMQGSAAERWVRAKTGLLNGAVGLAGFAGRPHGEVISFAFIYNGGGNEEKARNVFDRFAAALAED